MTIPRPETSNPMGRINERLLALERKLQELASASGTLDAATIYKGGLTVLDPATGARLRLSNGGIAFWSDFVGNPDRYGLMATDVGNDDNFLTIYAPYTSGNGRQNTITLQGSQVGEPGNFFVFTDGTANMDSSGAMNFQADGRMTWDANGGIDIFTAGAMRILELPTTGSAANIRLDPATAVIQYVTSSRRYKDDIEDAVVEPREVLQLQPRTWVDKGTKERSEPGTEIPRNVGFIAEELHEIPSMRQFVDYIEDDHGDLIPDAIQYDRLSVALLVLAKDQQSQIDRLAERLDALESQQ